jgi:hypothetical protein
MSMSNLEMSDLQWRKARRSVNNGACVEVAPVSRQMFIRDSTDRSGPVMRYSHRSWGILVEDIKMGRFDPDRL